jgi:hypothetical protein
VEKICREQFDLISPQTDMMPVEVSLGGTYENAGNLTLYPLGTDDRCIGLLGLSDDNDMLSADFSGDLLHLLSYSINGQFEMLKTEREISNLNKYLTVSSMLAQSIDLHDLLETTLNCCMEAVYAEAASILLLDDEKKNFFFYQSEGPVKPVLLTITFPSDKGIAASVLKNHQSEIINEVQSDPRFFGNVDSKSGLFTQNMIAVPLIAGEEKIGFLEVLNKAEGDSFTFEEHMFLQLIAEEIAFAFRNARLFDYIVNSYCKQSHGLPTCKGCKRPLGSWTPCVKYQNLSGDQHT